MKSTSTITLALALIMCAIQPVSAEIVDSLDFSIDDQGASHTSGVITGLASGGSGGAAPNDWVFTYGSLSSDSTTNFALTNGGVMEIRDWGNELTITGSWTATEDGTLDVVGEASAFGDDVFSASSESFTWFYSINGGGDVEFVLNDAAFGGNDVDTGASFNHTFSNIAISSGDVVSYGFSIDVDGAGDGADVTLNQLVFTAVPEPTSALMFGTCLLLLVSRRRGKI